LSAIHMRYGALHSFLSFLQLHAPRCTICLLFGISMSPHRANGVAFLVRHPYEIRGTPFLPFLPPTPCSSSVHYLPIVRDRHVSTWSKWMLTFVLHVDPPQSSPILPNPPRTLFCFSSPPPPPRPQHITSHHHLRPSRNTASPPSTLHNAHSLFASLPLLRTLPFR